MQKDVKEKKVTFIKWYEDVKRERDAQIDNWELARSASEELDEMIEKVTISFDIIDGRIKSHKTYGLVFDAKKNNHTTVLDALINEKIGIQPSSQKGFYMKSDPRAKRVNVKQIKDPNSNMISEIRVPSAAWPLDTGVRLNISNDSYASFIQKCQKKHYFIDLVILTLNSKDGFEDPDIKSLLKVVNDNQYNIILLLNDAPKSDCTYWRECDTCYEDKRDHLATYGLPADDRFIKISAKKTFETNIPKRATDKSFEKVVKIIKEELTMENVVGRYLKGAALFMNNFEEVKKMVLEVKLKVENQASNFEKILEEKKIETDEVLRKSKNETSDQIQDIIKESCNIESINKDFVKINVEPILKERFTNFRKKFKKQILRMVKTDNPMLEQYITTMYFNDFLKEDDYEIKLKKTIETCLEEVLCELKDVNKESKSVLENFLRKTKGFVEQTFDSIGDSFETFKENMKEKVLEKFDKFENTIQSFNDEFTECLKRDLENNIQRALPSIDMKIGNTGKSIESFINNVVNKITDKIKEKKFENLFPNSITDHINLTDHAANVSKTIEDELLILKNEIVEMIKKIGTDQQTKAWTNNLGESFKTEYFQRSKIQECKQRSEEAIRDLDLEDQNLYTSDEPDANVYKDLNDLYRIMRLKKVPDLKETVGRIKYFRRLSSVASIFKFIKDDFMIDNVKDAETVVKKTVNTTLESIQMDLRECILKKSWLS